VVDNKYKEIIERLREAKVDLGNAELTIMDRINKIMGYLNENFDEEQFDELQFLGKKLEEIKEIIGEIDDIILDLQDPSRSLGDQPIIFDSPYVQKYIMNGAKLVATITKSGYYYIGKSVVMKIGDEEFYGKVVATKPITLFTLSEYVGYSGFGGVWEWMYEASQLYKTRINPNKFEIVIIEVDRK